MGDKLISAEILFSKKNNIGLNFGDAGFPLFWADKIPWLFQYFF